jgi:hypothetical protein
MTGVRGIHIILISLAFFGLVALFGLATRNAMLQFGGLAGEIAGFLVFLVIVLRIRRDGP